MTFKITSLNVNGLNSPQKKTYAMERSPYSKLWCLLYSGDPLQRRYLSHSQFPHTYFANAPTKKLGVAILIKHTVAFKHISSYCNKVGRYIILTCEINNVVYTIVSTYAPNIKQISFLNKLWKKVKQRNSGHTILCGDLNAISNQQMDISNTNKKGCRPDITNFAQSACLYVVWRCHHSTERDFLCFSQVHLSYSRIDMFLLDTFLLQQTSKPEIGSITWMDRARVHNCGVP